MKAKIVLLTLSGILLVAAVASTPIRAVPGQWSGSGSYVYYNDGNVGIGTATPSAKLHLWGTNPTLRFEANTSNGIISSDAFLIFRMDDNNDTSNTYTAFQDYTGQFLMKIRDDGNIGIGTDNPTRKLSVNGTVLAKEVIVSTASGYWPDYVFEEGYKLMPLKEVENFIKTNGHLPNVPPASEIQESGQSLGEIQIKQMEKIEELTLHLIEKDRQITELQDRLTKLENLVTNN